jgi:hypothetical protein
MAIKISLPHDVGPRTKALADQLHSIANDRTMRYSDQDLADAAISGLIGIVAELELDVAGIKAGVEAARQQAVSDDLQFRSYGGGR